MRDSEYDHIEREIAKRRATSQPPLARVNPIFTQKPYSACGDLGEIMRKRKQKLKKRELDHKQYLKRKAKDGWQEEQREKRIRWRNKNRDILHEEQKRYREKHAEELRARRKAYYEANKEHIKARIKANYYKRKEQDGTACDRTAREVGSNPEG